MAPSKLLVPFLVLYASSITASDIIETSFGKLEGQTKDNARAFLGVPYAKPPTGLRRFQDPEPWTEKYFGTRKATKLGSQCVSNSQKKGEEGCLFINVYTPANATDTSKLPVLFFIHGGSFVEGSGNDYDCSGLATKHNAVYVTVNYRLGAFGWLQVSKGVGNFGFRDQRMAIQFTKAEISAFGGDPERILVFGESAGAISVQNHVIASGSAGLFTHALSESGFPSATPQEFALNATEVYIKAAKCNKQSAASTLSCLQSKSTSELTAAAEAVSPSAGDPFTVPGWGPTIDMVEFSDDPLLELKSGKFNRNIVVIAGSNTDEGTLFTPVKPLDKKAYESFIEGVLFGHGKPFNQTELDAVLKVYPETNPIANHKKAAEFAGDITFVCGSRFLVRAIREHSPKQPTFLYHFDIPTGGLVLHASEIPYVFDNPSLKPDEKKVAAAMGSLWYSFAEGVGPTEAQWPQYTAETDQNIIFQSPMKLSNFATETGRRKEYCDFWETMPL